MKHSEVTIISNGTIYNESLYSDLIKLGVRVFQIPLHSINEKTHDELTGVAGSHNLALKSIKFLNSRGIMSVPLMVLTKKNLHQVRDIIKLSMELGCYNLMLNRFNPGGEGIKNVNKLLPSINELRDAFSIANQTASELPVKISSNVCTPWCILNPTDYPELQFSKCNPEASQRPLTYDFKGNIRFCNHSPVSLGNLFNDTWDEITGSHQSKIWEDMQADLCKGCSDLTECNGGCRASAEQYGHTAAHHDILINLIGRDDNH